MDTPSKRAKPSWWAEFKASREEILSRRGINRNNPELNTEAAVELYMLSVFINDQVTKRFYPVPNLLKDAMVKPLVARVLATDNALWETLFHRDLPEYDILYGDGKKRRDRIFTTPPAWIGGAIKEGTDPEYDRVPWRRFYMWCVFFERMSLRILGQWVYNKASAWAADPNRQRPEPPGLFYFDRERGWAPLPVGTLDSFSSHPNSMYLIRTEYRGNKYAATAVDITLGEAYKRTNSNAEFVKLQRASSQWCNLEHLTGLVIEGDVDAEEFIARNLPVNTPSTELTPLTASIMANACRWSAICSLWPIGTLKNAENVMESLSRLPSVPRVRVTRVDPGTGMEAEEDILYVAGRCAGDTCLNEPVGTSVVDGLHYCSKECQPIARFVDRK